jgi:hypothetical protein
VIGILSIIDSSTAEGTQPMAAVVNRLTDKGLPLTQFLIQCVKTEPLNKAKFANFKMALCCGGSNICRDCSRLVMPH